MKWDRYKNLAKNILQCVVEFSLKKKIVYGYLGNFNKKEILWGIWGMSKREIVELFSFDTKDYNI